jgi:hypothetical protein
MISNKQQFGLNPDSEEIAKTGWHHSGPALTPFGLS